MGASGPADAPAVGDQQQVHLVAVGRGDQGREDLVRPLGRRGVRQQAQPPSDAEDMRVHGKDGHAEADTWLLTIEFSDGKQRMHFLSQSMAWTPSPQQWEAIKGRSRETAARVTVLGYDR